MTTFDQFQNADVRTELFDIRALGFSARAILEGAGIGTISQDDTDTLERLVKIIIERAEGAAEHINNAESAMLKEESAKTA